MRHLRLGLYAVAGCAAVVLAAGCGVLAPPPDDKAGEAEQSSPPADTATESKGAKPTSEASEAGGICKYLDFASVSDATGQAFSVAEAGGADEVTSCVLLTTVGKLPEVTLTRAKTATDAETYQAEIPPEGSEAVDDLGKTAYSAVRGKEGKIGPAVEIGWLANGQMYSLRFTTAPGTDKKEVGKTVDALVKVARQIGKATAKDDKKD